MTDQSQPENWMFSTGQWTLPVLVLWDGGTALVRLPKIPLLAIQRHVLSGFLNELAFNSNEDGWFITSKLMEVSATPFHGDPEGVVVWNAREAPLVENKMDAQRSRSQWIETLGKTVFFRSFGPDLISMAWDCVCQAAADWVLNKHRTLSMDYWKIDILPYRIDWKEIVASVIAVTRPSSPGPTQGSEYGWAPFVSGDLTSCQMSKDTIDWCLEIRPTGRFESFIDSIEAERRAQTGDNYWLEIADIIRLKAPLAHFIYKTYDRSAFYPYAKLPSYFVPKPGSHRKKIGPEGGHHRQHKLRNIPVVLAPEAYANCPPVGFPETPPEVLPLPGVQPPRTNLWHKERHATKTRRPDGRPVGVSLPDAVRSERPKEEVLVSGEDW